MCMTGILVNGVLKQNISEDAIIQSVQFSHNGDDWSFNFSIANNMKDGKWEYDNEQIYEAIDIGLSDLTLDEDGGTYLTYSYTLPSGGTVQQSARLQIEMGEFKVSDDSDGPTQDFSEIDADIILNRMKEIFGLKPVKDTETMEGVFKKYADKKPSNKCCKDGCCCKKKDSIPRLSDIKREYLSKIWWYVTNLCPGVYSSEEKLKRDIKSAFFDFDEPFGVFIQKAYALWMSYRWYNDLLSYTSVGDFAGFLTELFYKEL